MAGIGFELRRILQKDSFAASAHAYTYGGVIVLGPFLSSVIGLGAILMLARGLVDYEVRSSFAGATVWVFGLSQVVTGAVQVVLTRYLADLIYRGEHERLSACLFPALALAAGALAVVAAPLGFVLQQSLLVKALLWSLLLILGCLWMVVVFASAAHHYRRVVAAFVAGAVVAVVLAVALARRFGLAGLLAGYTAGQALILVLLLRQLIREFGTLFKYDWGLFAYFRRYPSLIAVGLLQGLGVWIDKALFWSSGLAIFAGGFATAPKYDSAMFLGFLTAIPALTHFIVRIEADFSQQFHQYFDVIFHRRGYADIARAAADLRRGVIDALLDILKVQGAISFVAAALAGPLLERATLPMSELGMFRYAITASLFFSFMLFANVVLLYLDRRREVLISGVVFAGSNLVFSAWSLSAGYPWYGAGFAAACFLGLLVSLFFLADQLFNLEYRTFSSIALGERRRPELRVGKGYLGRANAVAAAADDAR